MIFGQHHIRKQLSVLNALSILPWIVVSLAVDPPSLPEADVVLPVEVVEALVADLVV